MKKYPHEKNGKSKMDKTPHSQITLTEKTAMTE
jgi:hypothetical protein